MKLTGEVIKVRYVNEENGYSVFDLNTSDGEIKIVGIFDSVNIGESLEVEGEFTYDNKYGEQLNVSSYQKKLPSSTVEIEKYLASGIISTIGPKNASYIVKQFGKKSLDIVFDETDKLLEVRGIGKKSIEKIKKSVEELKFSKNILFHLTGLGISLSLSKKIYNIFRENTLEVINENPYKLIKNVKGIGFLKADEIALKNNLDKNSPYRIESAILYVLTQKAINFGHVYYPKEKLTNEVSKLIGVETELIEPVYMNLLLSSEVVIDNSFEESNIYLDYLYVSESYIASKLAKMALNDDFKILFDIEKEIKQAIKSLSIKLSKIQIDAIKSCFEENISIITGGPGTGKTTIINTISKIYLDNGYNISLCAPTGRAAKRIEETTGIEAKTIHRMLGYIPSSYDDIGHFEYNEDNPLDTDVIIIDEMSMVDVVLFEKLLRGMKDNTRLVIVGDVDQLPSVGAGNVLRDLINSKKIKYTKLVDIFRQSESSNIIVNAHKINNGQEPILNEKNSDFFFLKTEAPAITRNVVVDLISKRLPKAYGYDFSRDIQILTQSRKGICGVFELNRLLQDILNPKNEETDELLVGNKLFRVNDKVMQTKNNYNLSFVDSDGEENFGVYNGDMGHIIFIDKSSKKLTVEMDDKRLIDYTLEDLDNLELAYAITIHKSQGSEFKSVIIPMFDGYKLLQTRNLLYTAITRAKENIVLVGDKNVMNNMIRNNTINSRYSNLENRIKHFYGLVEELL
ncbi:SF1B family DNA helicase RecD2 [Parvimonas micra]|uniref:SF1B family DNA helicase RecD2 n=1 Tax=Parvimonas micra TaxID=33033 RepID=UPI001CB4112E|nr:ATP-dependent RecD-like DNA helicase [Parvimonas micra]MBF1275555.1 ATP-dependent RecD-like DNA helicase [Parvimonas micra]MCK6130534.1 ATP-dependent RecD-like DNA helicase [Parvimonas micra]MCK6136181.1 ATP-dependent RecD-like DNA helicase [Parvimonas micra]MCK6137652.1 ATP-dependent RecD-like DNA helicase [Parvimonas micra]MCK6154180.1 ATP-dependent RecD-like DNA helicase [Parvimonas micra]